MEFWKRENKIEMQDIVFSSVFLLTFVDMFFFGIDILRVLGYVVSISYYLVGLSKLLFYHHYYMFFTIMT